MSCPTLPPNSKRFAWINGVPYWINVVTVCLDPSTVEDRKHLAAWYPVIASDGASLWLKEAMAITHTDSIAKARDYRGDPPTCGAVALAFDAADAWINWKPPL